MDKDKMRREFEEIHCGNNKHVIRRNEHGFYVLPSIQDAWGGFQSAWQACAARTVPEGWMRDICQVESLIGHLESIAYYQTINGDIECINQVAAMSVDVLRLLLLPLLAAAPSQERV